MSDNQVSWELEGLYEEGRLKSKKELHEKPPSIILLAEDGALAEVLLTKNVAYDLFDGVKMVRDAYHGIDRRDELSLSNNGFKHRWGRFVSWVKDHSIITAITSIVVIAGILVGVTR